MTTSGTYNFSVSNGEVVLAAYARLGIRRPSLTQEHFLDARNELNFLLAEWANQQVNLFNVDLVEVDLVQGTTTYAVDANTVMILDAYISTGDSPAITDRLIFPISRSEYASYPDKTLQGFPSVFWFDRLMSPTITLWAVPDASSTYTLKYYRVTQNQDANIPNGETPAVPYRWIDALVSGLAYRLSKIHAQPLEQIRQADADRAWSIAATQDVENVNLAILPGLSSYNN